MLNPITHGISIIIMHPSSKEPIMSIKLRSNIQKTGKDGNIAVPQNVLDYVQGALSAYGVSWDKVKDAILSPEDIEQKPNPLEDRFLSTEEVASFFHVSRVSIHRYCKAGKLHAYKMGRRNLFSLSEVMQSLKGGEVSNA